MFFDLVIVFSKDFFWFSFELRMLSLILVIENPGVQRRLILDWSLGDFNPLLNILLSCLGILSRGFLICTMCSIGCAPIAFLFLWSFVSMVCDCYFWVNSTTMFICPRTPALKCSKRFPNFWLNFLFALSVNSWMHLTISTISILDEFWVNCIIYRISNLLGLVLLHLFIYIWWHLYSMIW